METVWRLARHVETRILAQWPAGPRRLTAAVSGGADSMCLLHLLCRLRSSLGFGLTAIHVHHGIRGESADLDEGFVREQCDALGIPLAVVRADAPAFARQEGLSLEDAARRLRHQAFQSERMTCESDAVVLAHHRDDQAETVLMNLLRGAASSGLCGMQPYRDGCFRPLLDISGDQLRLCLSENGWPHREDGSNRDVAYRRNALRHRCLPMLREQLGHDPTGPLVRFAALQQQDQALLWQLAEAAAAACRLVPTGPAQPGLHESESLPIGLHESESLPIGPRDGVSPQAGARASPEAVAWSASALAIQPESLARRVVLLAWEQLTGSRADLEAVHVDAVLQLCCSGKHKGRLDLPRRIQAVLEGDACRLEIHPARQPPGAVRWAYPVRIPDHVGESTRLEVPEAGGVLVVTRIERRTACALFPDMTPAQSSSAQLIDSSALPAGMQIRNRRNGDRFFPWRSPGERKLKDWLSDRKVPLGKRDQIPLLAAGRDICWVIGIRTSGLLDATEASGDLLLLAWEHMNRVNQKTKGDVCGYIESHDWT